MIKPDSHEGKNLSTSNVAIVVIVSFLLLALIYSSTSRLEVVVQGKPVFGPAGEKKCTSDFFSRTCCWIDTDTEAYKKFCETCIDQGDGTYANCKTTEGPVAMAPPETTPPPKNKVTNPNLGGVFEQPISPNSGGVKVPKHGRVLEQPSTDQGTSKANSGNNSK